MFVPKGWNAEYLQRKSEWCKSAAARSHFTIVAWNLEGSIVHPMIFEHYQVISAIGQVDELFVWKQKVSRDVRSDLTEA